jgi:hypothetical protein
MKDVTALRQKAISTAARTVKRRLRRSSAAAAMPVAQPVRQPGPHGIDATTVFFAALLDTANFELVELRS